MYSFCVCVILRGIKAMIYEFFFLQIIWQCFFFQAEDGIRDRDVTGVQTCALPISEREKQIQYANTYIRNLRTTGSRQLNVLEQGGCREGW